MARRRTVVVFAQWYVKVGKVQIRKLCNDHSSPLGRCCTRKSYGVLDTCMFHDALGAMIVGEMAGGATEVDGLGDDV